MHITLPHKADNLLRFLKLKILPKKLFFRTMLLIFVPLISGIGFSTWRMPPFAWVRHFSCLT